MLASWFRGRPRDISPGHLGDPERAPLGGQVGRTLDASQWTGSAAHVVALLLCACLAIGGGLVGASPAIAVPGDFTVSLEGPETVTVGDNYNYVATVDSNVSGSATPIAGMVLTTRLPEGTTFAGLPTGDASPVQSHSYDPATRQLVINLKDTNQHLLSVVYTVSQVEREKKYEGFPLDTVMTGTGGNGETVTSAPVHTTVSGTNDFSAGLRSQVLTGSDNRTVTYFFNVCAVSNSTNFDAYGQELTDIFPPGTELVTASTDLGSWDTSRWPTAVWKNGSRYGQPATNCIDPGSNIHVTVRYPATVPGWETGQQAPANTVTLQTSDAIGTKHEGRPSTVQSPAFAALGNHVAVTKTSEGPDSAGTGRTSKVNASYIGSAIRPDADELVLTDSGAPGAGAESWYHHNDVQQIRFEFNTILTAADLPYDFEYQVDYSGIWQTFSPVDSTTGSMLNITVQNVGSIDWDWWQSATDVVNLPVGSVLTGWRLSIASGSEMVPGGAEVRTTMGAQPIFRDIADGVAPVTAAAGSSPGAVNNTATVSGGAGMKAEAADAYTPRDGVYLSTNVTGPDILSVGDSATYRAGIVNQNPSDIYIDAHLSVVLPCGVFLDEANKVTPVTPETIGVDPVPGLGSGMSVDSARRTVDEEGCSLQVVTLTFDQIAPMRAPGEASSRLVERTGWQYDIPVSVLPQAYDADGRAGSIDSYAYTDDPRFVSLEDGGTGTATVPMIGYGPFFSPDRHNFDAARDSIAKASTGLVVNTAGGLLIGQLSSADTDGPWAVDSTVGTDVFWQIYVRNVLPSPLTGITFFDRLPSIAAGDDFDVLLASPVTGIPGGAIIEYSTDATNADNGTWTTQALHATAFRIKATTLDAGDDFTLSVPTTVLNSPASGQNASNVVTAMGTYNGAAVEFVSNEASVTIGATPSMTLVKKTNGADYTQAPGAIVGVNSLVTWTYEVSNTGDTPLTDVIVSDAFTAGDGSTGSLIPSSEETGPLKPGATRVYSATGVASAGQYHNTATATATATDASGTPLPRQPASVSDDSWYLAGQAGLAVLKTTNSRHAPSAPGVPLMPGSEVKWTYTVTNTGELALSNVLVVDADSHGNIVHAQTVPSLAPGESVTLRASGEVIEGQYHSTVTASAGNPGGGPGLVATDDSYYFGIVTGLQMNKLVSTSENGPWSQKISVHAGATIYWLLSVTNTGNVALTDVRFDDPALGSIAPVASLAPGETAFRIVAQHNVTTSHTSPAITIIPDLWGSGHPQSGNSDTQSDAGNFVVAVGALARTGLGIQDSLLVGGFLLLGSGCAVILAVRRCRENVQARAQK